MYYYEVIPSSNKFHGKEPLTYHYGQKLSVGQVVHIKLRNLVCIGIVINEISKPEFDTLGITKTLDKAIIPKHQLLLLQWMREFYPSTIGVTSQLFAPSFLNKTEVSVTKSDYSNPSFSKTDKLPELTEEQSSALKIISKGNKKDGQTYILHGVTGSGKTRLYIELAKKSLSIKKSVIILTPEISLATPIAERFKNVFKDKVEINHSSLTDKQRRELWGKAFGSKDPLVIIGPRSSLFLPIKKIGLIVVDEFHEPAYKQDSKPFYHANRVASMLSRLSSAELVLGSATPSITDYYLAKQKDVPIITLKKSAITGRQPDNKSVVIDLLDKHEKTNYPLISKTLISHITDALGKGEQVMVFINKRGSARAISCQDCGYREVCKNCDLPMVYHGDQHLIRCHTCGYSAKPPVECRSCGSSNIYFSSPGTKAIAENLAKLFPEAKISRFDRDNKKAERLENTYDKIIEDIDIIVGTQLIAKGHDLPRLSVVAMLLADSELDFPDYSSTERSYQLIKQLAGRTNRGHVEGIFIVQSFKSSSKFIESATSKDWNEFYDKEISQRREHGFPPFYYAAKVESSRKSRKSAAESLDRLIETLDNASSGLDILGPSPSFIEKKSGKWHWQILIRTKNRRLLTEVLKTIPGSFRVDIDPNNFL